MSDVSDKQLIDLATTIADQAQKIAELEGHLKYHDLFKKWQAWRDPDELVAEYEKYQAASQQLSASDQRIAELEEKLHAIQDTVGEENWSLRQQLADRDERVKELGGFDDMSEVCRQATLRENTKEEIYSWTMFYMRKLATAQATIARLEAGEEEA